MGGPEVLVRVLLSRERVLGDHPRPHAALAGVVHDRHLRKVPYLPAVALHPQTQVGLLGVDEAALVEQPGAEHRLAAGEHERAGGPVARALLLVGLQIEHALPGPRPGERGQRSEKNASQSARPALGKRRIVGHRVPSAVSWRTPTRPTCGRCVEHLDQLAEGPVDDFGVRVEQQHVAGIASVPARGCWRRRSLGSGELTTRASGKLDSTNSRVPSVDSLSTTTTSRLAPPGPGEGRRQALLEPVRLVRGDDHDPEVGYGVGAVE